MGIQNMFSQKTGKVNRGGIRDILKNLKEIMLFYREKATTSTLHENSTHEIIESPHPFRGGSF